MAQRVAVGARTSSFIVKPGAWIMSWVLGVMRKHKVRGLWDGLVGRPGPYGGPGGASLSLRFAT